MFKIKLRTEVNRLCRWQAIWDEIYGKSGKGRRPHLEDQMNDLPPELKHIQTVMDQVFSALEKSSPPNRPWTDEDALKHAAKDPHRIAEDSIMKIPGFDYGSASDLLAALSAKLNRVYEEKLDAKVEESMDKLKAALDRAYGNG